MQSFQNFNTTEFLDSILGSNSFSEEVDTNLGNSDGDFKDEIDSSYVSRSSSEFSLSTESIPVFNKKTIRSSDPHKIREENAPVNSARSIFASLRTLSEDNAKGSTNDKWPGGKPREIAALEMLRMQKLFRELEEKYISQISDLRSQLNHRKEDFRDLVRVIPVAVATKII